MTARKQYRRGEHPYGPAYKRARAILLASGPLCHWCDAPATTADHDPPLEVAGPHLHLVPACARCNYGRHGKSLPPKQTYPGPSRVW